MRSLDRISTAVHHARKEHAERDALDKKVAKDVSSSSCPEQDHPAVEQENPAVENAETFAFGDSLKSDDIQPVPPAAQDVPEVTCEDENPFG
jgi:hypothetical protein